MQGNALLETMYFTRNHVMLVHSLTHLLIHHSLSNGRAHSSMFVQLYVVIDFEVPFLMKKLIQRN